MNKVARHIKGLEHLREDLLMRAEVIDGQRVVSVGHSAWLSLKEAIVFLHELEEAEQ